MDLCLSVGAGKWKLVAVGQVRAFTAIMNRDRQIRAAFNDNCGKKGDVHKIIEFCDTRM